VSHARADVNGGGVVIDRSLGRGFALRNRTRAMHYDKFYQNVFSGAVDTSGAQVSLQGYNNATERRNLFNQTDVTGTLATGVVRHTLLAGAELSRQRTDNVRNTAYFNGSATSTTTAVPFATPTSQVNVAFRQSTTDADNHVQADVGALYAQDQICALVAVAGHRGRSRRCVHRCASTTTATTRTSSDTTGSSHPARG
jgi:catecholate siderophore receptor